MIGVARNDPTKLRDVYVAATLVYYIVELISVTDALVTNLWKTWKTHHTNIVIVVS